MLMSWLASYCFGRLGDQAILEIYSMQMRSNRGKFSPSPQFPERPLRRKSERKDVKTLMKKGDEKETQ